MITKEQAQTMTQEELTRSIPIEDIGQGYGYKNFSFNWEAGNPDEIIYIPEYGINEEGFINWENCYTKNDFIRLCENIDHNKEEYIGPETLFDYVDWQFPETVLEELDLV